MDPPEVLDTPSSPPTSNLQLAALLSDAFRDNEALKRDLVLTRKRAEKAERLVQTLTSESSPNGISQDHAQTIKRLIDDYDDRLAQADSAREEAETRRRVAQEGWDQVERYLALVESRAKDARMALTRISEGSMAPLVLPMPPPHIGPSVSTYSSNQVMAPPNVPSRQSSRRHPAAFPTLPPHPIPNPNPNLSPSTGTRRPRTPSLDGLYSAAQPPSKRSRSNTDDQRAREPRSSYSESYVGSMQQHLPDSRDYPEQFLIQARQQALQRSQAPRIIKYAPDPHGQPDSHGHSRSSSTSSLDVDEMLLRTTGDEYGGGTPNGADAPYLDMNIRRRSEREADSSRPLPAGNINGHPAHITTAANPYPQHSSSGVSYPANQSAPVMSSLRAPAQSSQNAVIQTHIFAPVVTGAPTKKTKFPNTIQAGPGSGVGVSGSGPSLEAGLSAAPTVPFPSTNAQGQRICRQCGMVGRYKDGKCVEKWGPGPMGPGTVCDRCRKKMKRVERRGTLESQHQQVANQSVQHQQHQPRSTSHSNLPLSQGSDRSIHRSDTILTHQPSHSPSSFSQSQSTRDRDASSSSHTQSNIRSSLSNVHPSSSSSSPHSTKPGSHHRPQSPSPTLKDARNDDDERHDPDQLPISNVGRGGGSGVPSRSSSRNAGVRAGTGSRPTPPVARSSDHIPNKKSPLGSSLAIAGGGGSGSPSITMEVDETDADADADPEAEAEVGSEEAEAEILGAVAATSRNRTDGEEEGGDDGDGDGDAEADADADAELLEAVDAAEANSSSSSHGGERTRMKSES